MNERREYLVYANTATAQPMGVIEAEYIAKADYLAKLMHGPRAITFDSEYSRPETLCKARNVEFGADLHETETLYTFLGLR